MLFNIGNNHIMDLGQQGLNFTLKTLTANNITYVGAGKNQKEAYSSKEFKINSEHYIFVSFGWEVIQCVIAKKNKPGVNPLKINSVISRITDIRNKNPNSKIVVLFHWNYELELYPQPMDRELAMKCIDLGANAIIGCHSHIVQGIEIYKGAPIVYSLGNWFIPQSVFF